MTSSRLAAGLVFAAVASAGDPQLYQAVEPHMGTLVRISVYTSGESQAKAAFRAAFDRIAEVDRALSDYQPESELNRVCRAAASRSTLSAGKRCSRRACRHNRMTGPRVTSNAPPVSAASC